MNHSLIVFIVAAWYTCHTEAACNSLFGPAGTVHCYKSAKYNDYQWATCRSNKYIQLISNNQHKCTDSRRTYCYYQCMIDVYGKGSGDVYSRCSCSPNSPQPTQGVKLPSWCYSPSGTNCTWFKECLSKAYPSCSETRENDYAIKFGEKFCELFNESYTDFSDQGKQWVSGVRKCLQIKLVPLLGQTRVQTCGALKTNTFETHAPCYLKPDLTSPSFCDLSTLEQLKVFWTIKSAFPGQNFSPSLKGMLDELGKCIEKTNSRIQQVRKNIEEKIKQKTEKPEVVVRVEAWLEDPIPPTQLEMFIRDDDWPDASMRSYFAGKVVNAMALQQKWEDVALFAYYYEKSESIRFLIADRSKYEIPGSYGNTPSTQSANMVSLLLQLSKDVNNTLNLQVDGESVRILTIHGCLDWNCNELAFAVTSEKPHQKYVKNVAESHKATNTLSIALYSFFIINSLVSLFMT